MTRLTKQQIRSKILLKLNKQKEENRKRKSSKIKARLFKIVDFKRAKKVMFYIALDGEVNTEDMIKEAIKTGKVVSIPICRKNIMTMRLCRLEITTKLKKGLYGVSEPAVKKYISSDDLDLVIVPGVAFDKKGNRLGRGKGYYDRFLKKLSPYISTIGLAFDFQILPSLPVTAHDVSVNRVLYA
ncbi:MAG: 5-formyltetrahydrofolate cyclo-ligase [Candidatus Omnitrophota bacterium]